MGKITSIILAVIIMSTMINAVAEKSIIGNPKPKNILWVEYLKMSDCSYHLSDTVAPNGVVYKAMLDVEGTPFWYCSETESTYAFSAIEYDDGTMGDALVLVNDNKYFYFILEEERIEVYSINPFRKMGSFKKAQLGYWNSIEIDGDEIKLVFEKLE